jgi:lipopolysaccharide export system permease protein
MAILTKYVLNEILRIFAVALVSLTLIMILFGLVREVLQQGLGPAQVVQLLPYILPNALVFAVPGTILLAVSIVFGRMSASNEVVAVKALGIHPWVLVWPAFLLAFVLSLTAVWLNDVAVSWGYRGIQRVVLEAVEDIVYGTLRTQKAFSSKTFSLQDKRVEGRKLNQPTIPFQSRKDSPSITLTAEDAELRTDLTGNVLTIQCRNGTADVDGRASFNFFNDTIEHEISLEQMRRKEDLSRAPSHLEMRSLRTATAAQRVDTRRHEQEMAAEAAQNLLLGEFRELKSERWRQNTDKIQTDFYNLHRLETEMPRRWANGFSCLCFVAIGVPMAIQLRNSDILKSFFICFLPILIVYYPLMMVGLDRAKEGSIPPYFVWSGNVLLGLWGVWLLRRVMRY